MTLNPAQRMHLVPADEPVLRRPAKPVTTFDRGLRRTMDEMSEMLHVWAGVGLAAPQIGIGLRFAVIEEDGMRIDIVNPKVDVLRGAERPILWDEGCLSIPHKAFDVRRPSPVHLLWHDRWGVPHERDFDGLAGPDRSARMRPPRRAGHRSVPRGHRPAGRGDRPCLAPRRSGTSS